VQGWLRKRRTNVGIETSCACCGKELGITVDNGGGWSVEQKTTPLMFHPMIDWSTFTKPNIIDDF
jgi:hypothetical protein